MKRFSFPLERVLSFRRRQLDLAESDLKRTLQRESLLTRDAAALGDEALACRGAATAQEETDGAALRLTGEYVVALDERRALTVEAKRLRIHQRDLDRQIEAETAELHLAKWGQGGR